MRLGGDALARPPASMKGFPRRGSDGVGGLDEGAAVVASMKGFPRRGSDMRGKEPS